MATLTPFHYRHGDSRLHAIDARFKIALLVMFSLSILDASPLGLFSLTLLTTLLMVHIRISIISVFVELRYFFVLLLIVFVLRLVSSEGVPLIKMPWITISKMGLVQGFMVCWRMLLVVLLGFLFVSSTRISNIKWSVQWLLSPVPFIPEKRIATMMGLIVRFIPVIFQKARDISEAQKARCVEHRKNPLYRLETFAMPLMRGVFQDADKLAVAMVARCYDEDQPVEPIPSRRSDWLTLAAGGIFCLSLRVI